MNNKIKGLVKWFNDAKGFGFVEHEKGDVFIHFSSIETAGFKTLKNGEEIEYELEDGDKGLHAKNVRRISIPQDEVPQKKASAISPSRSGLAAQIEVERIPDSPVDDSSNDSAAEMEIPAPKQQKANNSISKKL
jgi:CspA family cold shock protein